MPATERSLQHAKIVPAPKIRRVALSAVTPSPKRRNRCPQRVCTGRISNLPTGMACRTRMLHAANAHITCGGRLPRWTGHLPRPHGTSEPGRLRRCNRKAPLVEEGRKAQAPRIPVTKDFNGFLDRDSLGAPNRRKAKARSGAGQLPHGSQPNRESPAWLLKP